jgi:hypothetical protein
MMPPDSPPLLQRHAWRGRQSRDEPLLAIVNLPAISIRN